MGDGYQKMKISIGMIFVIVGAIGSILYAINLVPVFIHTFQGNYANATDIAVRVTVDKIISQIWWAIAIAIISPFLALFGIKLKTN